MLGSSRFQSYQHHVDLLTFLISKVVITSYSFSLSFYQLCFLNFNFFCFGLVRFFLVSHATTNRDVPLKKRHLFFLFFIAWSIVDYSSLVISTFYHEMEQGYVFEGPLDEVMEEMTEEKMESAVSLIMEHESCILYIMSDFLLITIPLAVQIILAFFPNNASLSHNYPGSFRYRVEVMKELVVYAVLVASNLLVISMNSFCSIPHILSMFSLRDVYHSYMRIIRSYMIKCAIIDKVRQSFTPKPIPDRDQIKCTICWQGLDENLTLPCEHSFHEHCLCLWLERDNSCPICRRKLTEHLELSQLTQQQQQADFDNNGNTNATDFHNNETNRPENSSVNGRQYAFSFRFDICFSFGSNALRSAEVASWANSYIPLVVNFNRFDTSYQDTQTTTTNTAQDQPSTSTTASQQTWSSNQARRTSSPDPPTPRTPEAASSSTLPRQPSRTSSVLNLNSFVSSSTASGESFFTDNTSQNNPPFTSSRVPMSEGEREDLKPTSSASPHPEENKTSPVEDGTSESEVLNSPAPSNSLSRNVGQDHTNESTNSQPNEEERSSQNFTHQPQLNRRPLMIQASIGANQLLSGQTNVGRAQFNLDTSRYLRLLPSVYVEMVRQSGSFISFHSATTTPTPTTNPTPAANQSTSSSNDQSRTQDKEKSEMEVLTENLENIDKEIRSTEEYLERTWPPPGETEAQEEAPVPDHSEYLRIKKTLHGLRMRRTGLQRVIKILSKEVPAASSSGL